MKKHLIFMLLIALNTKAYAAPRYYDQENVFDLKAYIEQIESTEFIGNPEKSDWLNAILDHMEGLDQDREHGITALDSEITSLKLEFREIRNALESSDYYVNDAEVNMLIEIMSFGQDKIDYKFWLDNLKLLEQKVLTAIKSIDAEYLYQTNDILLLKDITIGLLFQAKELDIKTHKANLAELLANKISQRKIDEKKRNARKVAPVINITDAVKKGTRR